MIKNTNFNTPVRSPTYKIIHDDSRMIAVPCGRCASCIHLKQVYLIQRVQMESLSNDLFYGTLTYNSPSLPKVTYGDITFAYPDFSDWQNMIKMIRKDYSDMKFKYMLVSEYGGKKHRPHFHFILSFPKTSDLFAQKIGKAYDLFNIFLKYWRRNTNVTFYYTKTGKLRKNTRNPIWQPLCTYVRRGDKYNYDLHYLDPNSSPDGTDGVSFYVTKYILKYDKFVDKFKSKLFFNLSEDDYKEAWSLFRPRCLLSKGFGSPTDDKVIDHINNGIDFALNSNSFFPYYLSNISGSTYPLSPYYVKKFVTESDMLTFVSRRPQDIYSMYDVDDFDKQQLHLEEMKSYLFHQATLFDFDDMDDTNIFTFDDYEPFRNSFSDKDFADSWQDT